MASASTSAEGSRYHLASFNRGLLKAPMADEVNKEFIASLGPVMAIAESNTGFVWRFRSGTDGPKDETYKEVDRQFPGTALLNLSLWESLDHLKHFLYRTGHAPYLRRKNEWFHEDNGALPPQAPATAPHHVLWWHPADADPPDFAEAMSKCAHLLRHGPTQAAFTIRKPFPPPGSESLHPGSGDAEAGGGGDAWWRQQPPRGERNPLPYLLLASMLIGIVALGMGQRKSA